MDPPVTVDVIVIGGGISGLCAAKLLQESGLKVVVLEARDRTGGRIHTLRNPAYGYVDLGAGYVGPTQRRMGRLVSEFGLKFCDVDESKKTVMNIANSWMEYKGTIPPIYNPITALDAINVLRKIETMAEEVPVDAPWNAPKAAEWDSMTLQEFMNATAWTRYAKEALTVITRTLVTSEPHEVSLLCFLWYIRSGQGLERAISITNGGQEKKIVGGSQTLTDKISEKLGEAVRLSHVVHRLQQTEQGVTVCTLNGAVYQGKYAISAMPITLLNRVTFEPALPASKIQLIQRIPMGSIFKVKLFYEKAFWKEMGLSGQASSGDGPVSYCLDDTNADGSRAALVCFVVADHSRDFLSLTLDERKNAVVQQLARLFKRSEFLHVTHYVEKNWMEEEYSGGCYTGVLAPGFITKYGAYMREPFARVHFAGTETAAHWSGYMEGGVQAGERAAREVLHRIGLISEGDIWQDEPPVENLPERPIPKHPVEAVLPSPTALLWMLGLGSAVAAVYLQKHGPQLSAIYRSLENLF